jgi:Raf kinase inhibitor-like YbhB/YbcL family protein
MRVISAISAVLMLSATGAALAQGSAMAPAAPPRPAMHAVVMSMTSSAFADGAIIPDQYTAKGGAAAGSFPLAWTGAPAGTQSFTLIMHDLDVVVGTTTNDNLHWLAFNIPATTTSLPASVPGTPQLADGTIQPKNRTVNGFTPPGAPPGIYHHYVVEVYALDTKLALGADATRDDVLKAMQGHVLDKAALVGRFHR